jgi:hypothetical protein
VDRLSRHDILRALHRDVRPRTYLEIGVNDGKSLALSRVPSIAIDPAFVVKVPISCDVRLVKATSDAFFKSRDPLGHFRTGRNPFRAMARRNPLSIMRDPVIEMAFIDGMHLFEFALRDFMNVERHSTWSTVIMLDDMLPRNVDEAARDRVTRAWAGDVYKVVEVLNRYRPDLIIVPIHSAGTGVLMVLGADPTNTVLADNYDKIVEEFVVPDPQVVPKSTLTRVDAVDPDKFLAAGFWPDLVRARNTRRGRAAFDRLRPTIEAAVRASMTTDARVYDDKMTVPGAGRQAPGNAWPPEREFSTSS